MSIRHLLILLFACLTVPVQAIEMAEKESLAEVQERIFSLLLTARPDLQVSGLRQSPLAGVYQVDLNGQVAFVSADGEFLIAGEMYQVKSDRIVNLQEQERQRQEALLEPMRAQRLAELDEKDFITYSPSGKKKTHVYVFTDIDCGFCRRLHGQMDAMLAKGIEVRYLAFPRAGISSLSAQKLMTAWCAPDARDVMTQFKQGKNVAINACDDTPVAEHYALGQQIGVRGTPAIVLASGRIIPGAVSPEVLAQEIGL